MLGFYIRNNVSITKYIISYALLFYCELSIAVTAEDTIWYQNKLTNTQNSLENQSKKDIEKGINSGNKYNNFLIKKKEALENKKESGKKAGVDDSCINISRIEFEGGDLIPEKIKKDIDNKYLGKCLKVSDIESIMSGVVNWYIESGFSTTRVYLEAQDLSEGKLKLKVQEGIVSDIILDDGGKDSIFLPTLFPFMKGKMLNLTKIEQGLYQANKQRSNKTTMEIVPGEKAGDSIIVVKNEPGFPLHLNVSIDNHGSKSTGQVQGAATLTVDNLIGINDVLTFTHRRSISDLPVNSPGKSVSDSLALLIPIGFFTHTLSYSRSTYESSLYTPSGNVLTSSGVTDSINASIDRVMYRNADTIVNSYFKLSFSSGKNYLDDSLLEVSSKDKTGAAIGSSISSKVFNNPFSFSLEYSQGLPLFGAENNVDNAPEYFPVNLFQKIKGDLSYTQPLSFVSDNVTLTSRVHGQYAFNNQPSSERLSIGSKFTVRGYLDNSLSGDNGGYISNELLWINPFNVSSGNIKTRLKAAYDIGWVENRYDFGNGFDGALSGGALGLTVSWKNIAATLAYNFPLQKPGFIPDESGQVWWRLNIDI